MRARHYGTGAGRWTSADPLWPWESAYGYVGGRATTGIDPTGYAEYKAYPVDVSSASVKSFGCGNFNWTSRWILPPFIQTSNFSGAVVQQIFSTVEVFDCDGHAFPSVVERFVEQWSIRDGHSNYGLNDTFGSDVLVGRGYRFRLPASEYAQYQVLRGGKCTVGVAFLEGTVKLVKGYLYTAPTFPWIVGDAGESQGLLPFIPEALMRAGSRVDLDLLLAPSTADRTKTLTSEWDCCHLPNSDFTQIYFNGRMIGSSGSPASPVGKKDPLCGCLNKDIAKIKLKSRVRSRSKSGAVKLTN